MKSSETFNLNIQTPESGDNDEISQLKAEMMSYKPLIDDAIKRQNLKEAEELFEEAKKAKAKLEAHKESLNKKESKENLIGTTQQPKIPYWENKNDDGEIYSETEGLRVIKSEDLKKQIKEIDSKNTELIIDILLKNKNQILKKNKDRKNGES
jgi:hypothetical protein